MCPLHGAGRLERVGRAGGHRECASERGSFLRPRSVHPLLSGTRASWPMLHVPIFSHVVAWPRAVVKRLREDLQSQRLGELRARVARLYLESKVCLTRRGSVGGGGVVAREAGINIRITHTAMYSIKHVTCQPRAETTARWKKVAEWRAWLRAARRPLSALPGSLDRHVTACKVRVGRCRKV